MFGEGPCVTGAFNDSPSPVCEPRRVPRETFGGRRVLAAACGDGHVVALRPGTPTAACCSRARGTRRVVAEPQVSATRPTPWTRWHCDRPVAATVRPGFRAVAATAGASGPAVGALGTLGGLCVTLAGG